ncbi:MAG TPA: ABC transporter permease [Clostridiaceae bacterium]|nr:ABC transporter permease [Clostridiaceae bacterium]HHV99093.1 ABC transporter permease [Clostridiaceae bacterium]
MLENVKYYISVALYYFKLSLQKQFEYPAMIISCVFMIPMMYGTGILLLYFMVHNFQPLGGWSFPQLAFLFGIGYLSHGLMMVFSVQNWWIESYVLRGEFDRMLLRPLSVFFQFTVTYINFIGLVDVLVGLTIFLYSCKLINFVWSLHNIITIAFVIIGGVLIRSSIFTIFCSVAFWTKRSESLFLLLNDMLERTTQYPMTIYPYFVQFMLTFIVPIAFISFYPACEILGKDGRIVFPLEMSVYTPIIGIVMFILANMFFNLGLKKYESAGS